jgi:hypothetical protein
MSVGTAAEVTKDGDWAKTETGYVREFRVKITDPSTDTVPLILSATGLPDIGDGFPGDTLSKCARKTARKQSEDDWQYWLVTCSYALNGPSGGTNDPTDDDPQISVDCEAVEVPFDRAYNTDPADTFGNPTLAVLNSAGDPFDPPAMTQRYRMVLQVQKNAKTFNLTTIFQYVNTTNSAATTVAGVTIPAKCGLIRRISARKAWDGRGRAYWDVTYEIAIDRETFTRQLVDQGYRMLDDGLNRVQIRQSDINPAMAAGAQADQYVTEPVHLLEGLPLTGDGPPQWLPYNPYYAQSWASLGLPATA